LTKFRKRMPFYETPRTHKQLLQKYNINSLPYSKMQHATAVHYGAANFLLFFLVCSYASNQCTVVGLRNNWYRLTCAELIQLTSASNNTIMPALQLLLHQLNFVQTAIFYREGSHSNDNQNSGLFRTFSAA